MKTSSPRLAPHVQIVIFLLLVLAVPRLAESTPSESQSAIPAGTKQKLAKVQIPFIANQGQTDKEVKFYARTFAGTVSVTETGELVYSFPKLEDKKQVAGAALKEELVGGKVTGVTGENPAVTKLNYFKGNDRSKWQTNIPSYDGVSLGEVYEGIDVKLKAYGNNVEKLFYVKPGAEPETIKIKLSGGKELSVNESGELEVEMEQGTVRFSKPVAFQEDGAKKEFVEVAYVLRGSEYGFNVGDYDRTKELVIDPILAATFLGGSSGDSVNALALDSTGNVYVAGVTESDDFPGVGPGSADNTFVVDPAGGPFAGREVFVAKLNSDLSVILAATFLGGSNNDIGGPLALDGAGNVYVAGETVSADFPGIGPGSADSTLVGEEGFVAKLNSDLSDILAATFLGGSSDDSVSALALDSTNSVYVAGGTASSDFPGIGPGSADSTLAEGEGFVAKLNSDLSSVLVATYVGGTGEDGISSLALDSTGNVYVAGSTTSSDFPSVGSGSADSTFDGQIEGFVEKLNSELSAILAATFLGGHDVAWLDSVHALALDNTGYVFAAGVTGSADFPGVGSSSADSSFVNREGFVAKLNSDLSAILAGTFLGGSSIEEISALALDSAGNVNVAGFTGSSDFPGVGPGSADNTFDGGSEAFVVKLNPDLSHILVATFMGGGGADAASALALDNTGNVYVAGTQISSSDFPGVGPGSADNAMTGSEEGFIVKLDANLSRGPEVVNNKVNFVVQSTSLNPNPVPGGPAGVFTITARLTNKSTESILEPINAIVKTLTNGNKLLSATEGNGGVGSKQAIDAGSDDILIPNESRTVEFKIGLANRNPFSFFVDVFGILSEGD